MPTLPLARRSAEGAALTTLLILVCVAGLAAPALAQGRDSTRRDTVRAGVPEAAPGTLSRLVALEVADLYNAPQTQRVSGAYQLAAGGQLTDNLAVLGGPVTIAGHVTGRVVVVNADVTLGPTARIDGDLYVVGGQVTGRDDAYVGGEIRIYREPLGYRMDGERLVATVDADAREEPSDEDVRWWQRWYARDRRNFSNLTLSSAHTYNRVEGLPIYFGPVLRRDLPWGRLNVEAVGILRTADNVHWDSENIGHRAKAEVQLGDQAALVLGGRLYDVVDAVEPWQLPSAEVGLASFFLHRDYRDYFDRHGGAGYVGVRAGPDASFTVSLADERWGSRAVRDPFTLFRNEQGWRANPQMDDGRFHVANATLRLDTRNDVDRPWAGWYLVADYERGTGRVTSFGPRTLPGGVFVPLTLAAAAAPVTYSRGFLDLRRYNRIAPGAQLNLRAVVAGWIGGDPLPLERRLSLGGAGSLPGYDFRHFAPGPDVLTCSGSPAVAPLGVPAQCDRVALAQIEYRGDLHFSTSSSDYRVADDDEATAADNAGRRRHERWRFHWRTDGNWVVFTDAGRGWMVGPRLGQTTYERDQFPALGTFRTDVGVGLDFDPVGVYVAKAVSDAKEPANFFVRVRKRF